MNSLNNKVSKQIRIERQQELNSIIEKRGVWTGLKSLIPTKKSSGLDTKPSVTNINDLNNYFSKMGNSAVNPEAYRLVPSALCADVKFKFYEITNIQLHNAWRCLKNKNKSSEDATN